MKAARSQHRLAAQARRFGGSGCRLCRAVGLLVLGSMVGAWFTAGKHVQAQPQIAPNPADIRTSSAYLLMIDHSGSMRTQDQPRGNHLNAITRWQAAKERAKEFLSSTPLKSDIWLAIFCDQPVNIMKPSFRTEQERQALMRLIDEQPEPQEAGTWLYYTLAKMLDLAQKLSEERDGRYVSVLIFSDGKDETSPPPWTKAKLEETFRQALMKNDNLWMFFAPIGEQGAVSRDVVVNPHAKDIQQHKHPLSIERSPSRVALRNAATNPEQSFVLDLSTTDDVWSRLEGHVVRFAFEPDPGQKIVVKSTASAPLRKGPITVQVQVSNAGQLAGDKEYSGKLRIQFPDLKGGQISGADFVQVSFQAGERPHIHWRIPESDQRFATGQAIQFKVITLQGADVTWEFGDKQTASGHDVVHAYNTPGKRHVKVSVVADPRIGGTEQEFDVEIIDVGVSINPVHEIVVEGLPHRFGCMGRGELQRYEWLIDGNVFDGRAPQDPAEGRSEITYTFRTPGTHEVRVTGYAEGAKPESKMAIEVLPRPMVMVGGGLTRAFSRPVEFSLKAPDGFERVTWLFGDGGRDEGNNRNPVHAYRQTGEFEIRAVLEQKRGEQLETRPVTVNVVAERPHPQPKIYVGGKPVERVVVGQTVELVDHSTGDIIKRTWCYDGEPLAAGQTTLPMLETGKHELSLVIEGPPDRSGSVATDMRPAPAVMTVYVAERPDQYKFWAAVGGALLGLVVGGRWLFGNAPAQWRLYGSNLGPPDENLDASVRVSGWWDHWRKTAVIPVARLFSGCEYWSSTEGCDQHIRVVALRRGERVDGTLEYSGEVDDRVVSTPPTGDDTKTDYHWTDNRCTCETPECKNLYVRLVRKHRNTYWPLVSWLVLLLVLVGVVWLVYRAVYQGTL